jgi:hypothetical protein
VQGRFRKSSATKHEFHKGRHRFEHWYRDNTVYFITSKTRDGAALFASPASQQIFWDRFDHYTRLQGFTPWVTTLMNNHYHTLGYLRVGDALGEMMRKIHGSVAWLVMKETDVRHVPFWRSKGNKDYFDGCIRDVLQARRAYRYTVLQSVRAGIVRDWRDYLNTRVTVELDRAVERAVQLNAFLEEVPYARYDRQKQKRHGHQR